MLGRLHLASHILRQVNRIQQLSKRLSNTNDPVQKATILHELGRYTTRSFSFLAFLFILEQLASDSDLKDIDAVAFELRNIRVQQQKVVKLSFGTLNQGVINENMIQATTALQVYNTV